MIDKTIISNEATFYYNNVADHKIMSTIFNSGNMFKLTITEEQKKSEFIHGYALASSVAENTKFGFLLVSAKDDTVNNFTNFETNNNDYVYEPIQKGVFGMSLDEANNPDQITRAEAEKRINRWNNWIKTSACKGIFRAFIIPTIDVEFGIEHNCFLAMREDKGELIADLIVVNNQTNKIISHNISNTTAIIEDMVRPVPPFKPSMSSSYENFGIFNEIWPTETK